MADDHTQKITNFSQDNILGNDETIFTVAEDDAVINIHVFADYYQKEGQIGPTGVALETKEKIFPQWTGSRSGCGISLFKFDTAQRSGDLISLFLKKIMRTFNTESGKNPFAISKEELKSMLVGNFSSLPFISKELVDVLRTEESIEEYLNKISPLAIEKAAQEFGAPGLLGNHFIELQVVSEVYDEETLKQFGLEKNAVVCMLHLDSVNLNIELEKPYRQIASIDASSEKGVNYYALTKFLERFCFLNRMKVGSIIGEVYKEICNSEELTLICDSTHDGVEKIRKKDSWYYVHRSGAARALAPGDDTLLKFKHIGQPLLLPASLGVPSYLMKSDIGVEYSGNSVNHGVKRKITKEKAREVYHAIDVPKELNAKKVKIGRIKNRELFSQYHLSYDDVATVLGLMEQKKLAKKVAKLTPIAIIKG